MRAVAYGKITYPLHMHTLREKASCLITAGFSYPIRIQFYGPAAKTKNPVTRNTERLPRLRAVTRADG